MRVWARYHYIYSIVAKTHHTKLSVSTQADIILSMMKECFLQYTVMQHYSENARACANWRWNARDCVAGLQHPQSLKYNPVTPVECFSLSHQLYYIYTSDAPCWNTGGHKIKKINKEIKARSVLSRPLCCDAVMNFLFHCVGKASIATTREQSVIVTSQLMAAGSCIDDVTIGQHFE